MEYLLNELLKMNYIESQQTQFSESENHVTC